MLARLVGETQATEAHFRDCLRLREALSKDAKNERRQSELMLALAQCGEHARAAALAAAQRGAANDPEVLVEVARCLAVCSAVADTGPRDEYRRQAVQAIADAIKAGYRDAVGLTTEPDLRPLSDDPKFKALLAGLAGDG